MLDVLGLPVHKFFQFFLLLFLLTRGNSRLLPQRLKISRPSQFAPALHGF
jgi:hypothetical protein